MDIALKESLTSEAIASRLLAIYCLGAIDDVSKLIDVLGDESTEHRADRDAAAFTLRRRWISRKREPRARSCTTRRTAAKGVLIDKKYKPREAETIYDLLHDFQPDDWTKVETIRRGCWRGASCIAARPRRRAGLLPPGRNWGMGAKLPPRLQRRRRSGRPGTLRAAPSPWTCRLPRSFTAAHTGGRPGAAPAAQAEVKTKEEESHHETHE